MRCSWFLLALFIIDIGCTDGQDEQYYEDQYANDNLYHNYAAREHEKAVGNQQTPWGKIAAAGAVGWFFGGKFHSNRVKKKITAKHKEEAKQIYTQYYNDVYTLKEKNAQLVQALEQVGYAVKS